MSKTKTDWNKRPSWMEIQWIKFICGLEKWIDELKCNHKKYGYKIGKEYIIDKEHDVKLIEIICGNCGKKGYLKEDNDNGEKWGRINFPIKEQYLDKLS